MTTTLFRRRKPLAILSLKNTRSGAGEELLLLHCRARSCLKGMYFSQTGIAAAFPLKLLRCLIRRPTSMRPPLGVIPIAGASAKHCSSVCLATTSHRNCSVWLCLFYLILNAVLRIPGPGMCCLLLCRVVKQQIMCSNLDVCSYRSFSQVFEYVCSYVCFEHASKPSTTNLEFESNNFLNVKGGFP